MTKNYLDYVTDLPYGITTQDVYDLKLVREALDESNFGMEIVKQRILEFIAVCKLKNETSGKIITLVGPPGVGKTTIATSIAKALGRNFERISCGGDSDPSALKGFRRTYIGSEPGKIAQAIKNAGSENPVILIDEIDKLGQSNKGDPSSVLLEVLDKE